MLLKQAILEGIRAGRVSVAYRRWRRPSVRAGGTLLTSAGQLAIGAVEPVDPASIDDREAARAGHASRDELLRELNARPEGTVFRIELGALGPDPRIALRQQTAADEIDTLRARLERLDRHAPTGPWTQAVLRLLQAQPGVRAGDLCLVMGQQKKPFKINVRKLKALGLTESLDVGYRLSPRGEALLKSLGEPAQTAPAPPAAARSAAARVPRPPSGRSLARRGPR